MAIVFISPRKTQKIIFWSITLPLALILFAIAFSTFLPSLKNTLVSVSSQNTNPSTITINFTIADSDQVKNLEPFSDIETEFSYVGQDKTGKQVNGKISAVSKDAAQKSLESNGITVSTLEEVGIGRSDPFAPYNNSNQSNSK